MEVGKANASSGIDDWYSIKKNNKNIPQDILKIAEFLEQNSAIEETNSNSQFKLLMTGESTPQDVTCVFVTPKENQYNIILQNTDVRDKKLTNILLYT